MACNAPRAGRMRQLAASSSGGHLQELTVPARRTAGRAKGEFRDLRFRRFATPKRKFGTPAFGRIAAAHGFVQASRMSLVLWPSWPAYSRASLYWLIGAAICAMSFGVALRLIDATLLTLPLVLAALVLTIWFAVVVAIGLWWAWKLRPQPRLVVGAIAAPPVAIALLVVSIWITWRAFGVLPWTTDRSRDFEVVAALPSPDGKWRAVYVEDLSGGPATGVGEDVYVAAAQSRALLLKDRVFSAECVQGVKLRWIGPRVLQVTYETGDPVADGLLPPRPLPWFFGADDERKIADPVKVVQLRRMQNHDGC